MTATTSSGMICSLDRASADNTAPFRSGCTVRRTRRGCRDRRRRPRPGSAAWPPRSPWPAWTCPRRTARSPLSACPVAPRRRHRPTGSDRPRWSAAHRVRPGPRPDAAAQGRRVGRRRGRGTTGRPLVFGEQAAPTANRQPLAARGSTVRR
jgi:hypothetical protein